MGAEDTDPWSGTTKDVREAIAESGTETTVATIADVEGSAYRRPGAKMVVTAEGVGMGAVTAGCLEPSVVDSCETVRRTGRARVERFDLTGGEDQWGLGLGCEGVIDILVEPRDGSWEAIVDKVDRAPIAVVTVIEADEETMVGDRVIAGETGIRTVPDRNPVPSSHLDSVGDTIERIRGTARTTTVRRGDATLLVDGMVPTPRLVLFGSQNDINPVVRLGRQAGFHVAVHAPRGGVDESTFPRASDVRTGHPSTLADGVDEYTYAVVMSHNLVDDRIAIETLLRETEVPYVGVMGPRERFDRIREDMALTGDELERVAAPVGLDLGGSTPTDIALSIVSEVVAVRNGRDGGRLRARSGPIHPTDTDR